MPRIPFAGILASGVVGFAQVLASLNNTIEKGMNTECKSCPYTLCTNVAAYGYDNGVGNVTLTCWTRGTVIDGDSTWLRTTDNCYVTQYDLTDYAGTYEDDLPYCGEASEKEFYTTQAAETKYDTECNIIPSIGGDAVHYHKPNTPLTVTCYTEGDWIIDDNTWLKTTSNCYVAQIELTHPAHTSTLENCGPIPFLEVNVTGQEAGTGARRSVLPEHRLEKDDLRKRYLINVTVGEDYALCHEEANSTSAVERAYVWDQNIWLQCLVINENANENETFWSWTTDFCYVSSVDLWESPEGDYYNFPMCDKFV